MSDADKMAYINFAGGYARANKDQILANAELTIALMAVSWLEWRGSVAPKGAAGQTTKLYRAMSEGEYNSLVKSGKFTQYDKAMETKWFATNADGAAKWGKQFYPNGNYKMVEIEVPKDSLGQIYNVNKLDGIGPAYNAERDFINSAIKSFKEVTR